MCILSESGVQMNHDTLASPMRTGNWGAEDMILLAALP